MKKIPTIKSVMTAFPYWVEITESLEVTKNRMLEHDISHLPVKEKGELVGVVSVHDIEKVDHILGEDGKADLSQITVNEVCVLKPYMVDLNEPLDNVLVHMANFHIGSVIVLKNNRLAGVFTKHDACRHFAELLRYQFRVDAGNDIA